MGSPDNRQQVGSLQKLTRRISLMRTILVVFLRGISFGDAHVGLDGCPSNTSAYIRATSVRRLVRRPLRSGVLSDG